VVLKQITKRNVRDFEPFLSDSVVREMLESPNYIGIGATEGTATVGAAVMKIITQNILLTELMVDSNHRLKGIGDELVNFCCEYAGSIGIPLLCVFPAKNECAPLYRLFYSIPDIALTRAEGRTFMSSMQDLQKMNALIKFGTQKEQILPFFSLTTSEQKQFENTLLQKNIYHLKDISTRKKDYIPWLSLCAKRDGEIIACVLVEQVYTTSLSISFAYCQSGYQRALMALFDTVRERIVAKRKEDCNLYITTTSAKTTELVNKILPQSTIVEQFYIASWSPLL
jgi:predicted N-acetyltransferase YhbS